MWFPYLRPLGRRGGELMGRAPPRLLLALMRLGRDGLIPGRMGPSYFLPLGLLPSFGRGLLSVTYGLAVTLPFKGRLGREAGIDGLGLRPPPEDVGRPTRGRLGLVVGPAGFNTGFGRLPPIGIAGLGRGRRGLTVVVFPRPGTTRLIFRSFIWN